jgi:hypothetical protein
MEIDGLYKINAKKLSKKSFIRHFKYAIIGNKKKGEGVPHELTLVQEDNKMIGSLRKKILLCFIIKKAFIKMEDWEYAKFLLKNDEGI